MSFKPVGKFADWNKREILANLYAAERHLTHISDTSDPDYTSCIVKHLNYLARSEFPELMAHDRENFDYWSKLKDKTEFVVDSVMKGELSPKEALDKIRVIRSDVEMMSLGFNVSKCKSCDEVALQLFEKVKTELGEQNPMGNTVKNLYAKQSDNKHSDLKMVDTKTIGLVYGTQHVGKAITKGFEMLDAAYPKAVLGLDPSLVLDVAATVAGVYGGMKLKSPYDLLAVQIGGYVSTDLWRHVEKFTAVGTGLGGWKAVSSGSNVPYVPSSHITYV